MVLSTLDSVAKSKTHLKKIREQFLKELRSIQATYLGLYKKFEEELQKQEVADLKKQLKKKSYGKL